MKRINEYKKLFSVDQEIELKLLKKVYVEYFVYWVKGQVVIFSYIYYVIQ